MFIAFSVDSYLHALYRATKVSLLEATQDLWSGALVWISHRAWYPGKCKCDLGNKDMTWRLGLLLLRHWGDSVFFFSLEPAPGICCSGPEFTETSGASTGGRCCWTQMGAMQDLTMACTHFFPGEGEWGRWGPQSLLSFLFGFLCLYSIFCICLIIYLVQNSGPASLGLALIKNAKWKVNSRSTALQASDTDKEG